MSGKSTPPTSDSEKNSDNNFEDITNTEDMSSLQINPLSIEDFDKNLPDTVKLLTWPNGAKVYLVGTAHFSAESQNDVSTVIQATQPHIVVIELCGSRTNILKLDERTLLEEAKNINLERFMAMIKENGLVHGLMYVLLLSMSAHLTRELGMAPGGEFRTAFREAQKVKHCIVHLGDRPINITIQRALGKLSWFQLLKLGWHLITNKDPISKEDVEKCKRHDMLEELLAEMTGEYPALGEVFVQERDVYLTHSLQSAANTQIDIEGKLQNMRVVGVVGIGHVPGICKLWTQQQTPYVDAIMTLPPPTLTSKVIKVTFKLAFLSASSYLIYVYVPGTSSVVNSIFSKCQSVFKNVLEYAKG